MPQTSFLVKNKTYPLSRQLELRADDGNSKLITIATKGTQKFNTFIDFPVRGFPFLFLNRGWLRNKKDGGVREGSVEEYNPQNGLGSYEDLLEYLT